MSDILKAFDFDLFCNIFGMFLLSCLSYSMLQFKNKIYYSPNNKCNTSLVTWFHSAQAYRVYFLFFSPSRFDCKKYFFEDCFFYVFSMRSLRCKETNINNKFVYCLLSSIVENIRSFAHPVIDDDSINFSQPDD